MKMVMFCCSLRKDKPSGGLSSWLFCGTVDHWWGRILFHFLQHKYPKTRRDENLWPTICGHCVKSGTQWKVLWKILTYCGAHTYSVFTAVLLLAPGGHFSHYWSANVSAPPLFIESHLQPSVFTPCVCAPDIPHFFYDNGPSFVWWRSAAIVWSCQSHSAQKKCLPRKQMLCSYILQYYIYQWKLIFCEVLMLVVRSGSTCYV